MASPPWPRLSQPLLQFEEREDQASGSSQLRELSDGGDLEVPPVPGSVTCTGSGEVGGRAQRISILLWICAAGVFSRGWSPLRHSERCEGGVPASGELALTTKIPRVRVAAYVYSGWHPIPERDESFHPGFTEWELLHACQPRFAGHAQPRVPALGEYDDRDPEAVGRRVRLALSHGIDALIYGVFWCRGKRVFEAGLDEGFLGSPEGETTPFACMWANRMPRRVLPVRRADVPVLDSSRRVSSDVDDFVRFVAMLAENYFSRPNYLTVEGRSYLSIYDSTFFLEELGLDAATRAIGRAREWLGDHGYPDLHLAAVEPNARSLPVVGEVGFDSVTHYVLLPDWKGPLLQDYKEYAERRAGEWVEFARASGIPACGGVWRRPTGQVPLVAGDHRRTPRSLPRRARPRARVRVAYKRRGSARLRGVPERVDRGTLHRTRFTVRQRLVGGRRRGERSVGVPEARDVQREDPDRFRRVMQDRGRRRRCDVHPGSMRRRCVAASAGRMRSPRCYPSTESDRAGRSVEGSARLPSSRLRA